MRDCLIYFFYDSVDTLLYIGKSTNLKSRLKNHFSPDSIKLDPWKQMVNKEKIIVYTSSQIKEVLVNIYKQFKISKNPKGTDITKYYNAKPISKRVGSKVSKGFILG